jgi:transcriptional regulator with XRE-family HTH domain
MSNIEWKDFGPYLKLLRENKRFSQSDLAQIIGCTRTHIWRLETGNRRPSKMLLHSLRQHLARNSYDILVISAYEQMIEYNIDHIDVNLLEPVVD